MENPVSVLVVDDEVEICLLLSGMLKNKGMQVSCAHSLEEARGFLKRDQFDLLFLDLNLPDGLGFHLLDDAVSDQGRIKFVIISAYDGNSERKRAESIGVSYFLPKPFNRKMVTDVLQRIDIPID